MAHCTRHRMNEAGSAQMSSLSDQQQLPPLPTAEPTPEAPLLGQTLKTERFRLRLTRVLNSGASGTVYEAIEETSRQCYAVKHMPNDSQLNHLATYSKDVLRCKLRDMPAAPQVPSVQHRFEATLHSRCSNHPRVLSLHDAAYNAFGAYLVLDYCPEGDLFSLICDVGLRGGEREARRLFLEACQAVSHCHRVGVYHRDIKPENLLVQRGRDGRLHVCLGDFGLATEHAWSTERGCGSPFYMSPECLLRVGSNGYDSDSDNDELNDSIPYRYGFHSQSEDEEDDDDGFVLPAPHAYSTSASDVWSLGILLCNLTSRRNPWRRADMSDQAYAYYLRDPHRALARILPVTEDVHRILRRALDPNPHTRCTLNELYESVRSCVNFWSDVVCEDVASVISAHDEVKQSPEHHHAITIDCQAAAVSNGSDDDVMPPSPTPSLEESTLDDSTEVESDDEIHSTPTPGTSSTDLSCINHHSADAEHQQQYITPAKNGQLDLTMMVNPGRASCDPTKANHDDTLVEYMPRVIPSALQAVEELAKLQKKDRYQRERSQTPTIDLPQQMPTESAEQRSITVTTNDATATTNNNNGSAFDRILPARWSDTLSRVLRADIISAIGLAQ